MKPTAIVYTSSTGHTRKYALLLGEQIGLPAFSLEEANSRLPCGSPVISMLTKGLASQKQRSAQDERMLELLSRDESYVSLENLSEVLRWYREEQL